MRRIALLFITFSIVLLSSCSINRGFVSGLTPNDIQNIQQFDCFSDIGTIGKHDLYTHSDSLSEISENFIYSKLEQYCNLPITGKIEIDDSITYIQVQREIDYLMFATTKVAWKNIVITPTIDSILEARGERFGLLILSSGFVRDNKNYAAQIGKSIAMGILSLGSFYTVPYKEASTVFMMIVDAQNDNIAYFRKSELSDNSPLKERTYDRHFEKFQYYYK